MKIKIEVDLPHSYLSVMKYYAKDYSDKSGRKYDYNDLVRDLIVNYVHNTDAFKQAVEISGKKPKDQFEV